VQHATWRSAALTKQQTEENFQLELSDDDRKSRVGHVTGTERKVVDEEK
jgi:hypothetical protein